MRVRDEYGSLASLARLPQLSNPVWNAPGEFHGRLTCDVPHLFFGAERQRLQCGAVIDEGDEIVPPDDQRVGSWRAFVLAHGFAVTRLDVFALLDDRALHFIGLGDEENGMTGRQIIENGRRTIGNACRAEAPG